MSRDLERLVHDWLHEPDGLPEPRIADVAPLVHHTTQQRGWLPPITRGRITMISAFKLAAASAILALFGGYILASIGPIPPAPGPVPAAEASPASSPTPAATEVLPPLPVAVEGTFHCTVVSDGSWNQTNAPGVLPYRYEGQVRECRERMSDPRVSGTFVETYSLAGIDEAASEFQNEREDRHVVFWGTEVMDDPVAGWDCSSAGTSDPTDLRNFGLLLRVCTGTGANAGLAYVAHKAILEESYGDFGDRRAIKGILYEGDPPPFGPPAPIASE